MNRCGGWVDPIYTFTGLLLMFGVAALVKLLAFYWADWDIPLFTAFAIVLVLLILSAIALAFFLNKKSSVSSKTENNPPEKR
jgi:membrane protein implicated in regulation of membrane protease activity